LWSRTGQDHVASTLCDRLLAAQNGAFSFNGLVVWYVPTIAFFIWILMMTPLMISAAGREPSLGIAGRDPVTGALVGVAAAAPGHSE
jgi:hypothetical protein